MRIGIFTDIHIDNFKQFSGPDGNRRLKDCLHILKKCFDIFGEQKCDRVVFMGDFFHQKKYVNSLVLDETIETLSDIDMSDFEVIHFIPGNHDWYDKSCSITHLSFLTLFPPIELERNYGYTGISDCVYILLPYFPMDKQKEILDKIVFSREFKKYKQRLLFIHATPKNSTTMAGFKFKKGFDFKPYRKHFDFMFCGDIHKRQYRNNLYICGAPMQHSFNDIGNECGVHIYDSKTNTVEFISLKGEYPEFIDVDDIKYADPRNFYRVTTSKIVETDRDNVVFRLKVGGRIKTDNSESIKVDSSVETMMRTYIRKNGNGYNKSKLMNTGLDLI